MSENANERIMKACLMNLEVRLERLENLFPPVSVLPAAQSHKHTYTNDVLDAAFAAINHLGSHWSHGMLRLALLDLDPERYAKALKNAPDH